MTSSLIYMFFSSSYLSCWMPLSGNYMKCNTKSNSNIAFFVEMKHNLLEDPQRNRNEVDAPRSEKRNRPHCRIHACVRDIYIRFMVGFLLAESRKTRSAAINDNLFIALYVVGVRFVNGQERILKVAPIFNEYRSTC